jgi:hypothetical protein
MVEFCSFCGGTVQDNWKFCTSCGSTLKIKSEASDKVLKTSNSDVSIPGPNESLPLNKPRTILILLVTVVFIILALGSKNKSNIMSTVDDVYSSETSTNLDLGSSTSILSRLNSSGSIEWFEDKSLPIDGTYPSGFIGDYLSEGCALWYFETFQDAEDFKYSNFNDMYTEVMEDNKLGFFVVFVADYRDASCYGEVRGYFL